MAFERKGWFSREERAVRKVLRRMLGTWVSVRGASEVRGIAETVSQGYDEMLVVLECVKSMDDILRQKGIHNLGSTCSVTSEELYSTMLTYITRHGGFDLEDYMIVPWKHFCLDSRIRNIFPYSNYVFKSFPCRYWEDLRDTSEDVGNRIRIAGVRHYYIIEDDEGSPSFGDQKHDDYGLYARIVPKKKG